MKTKTQNQALLAYLKKHRKGITTLEAMQHLGICRLSERIREIDRTQIATDKYQHAIFAFIEKTREKSANGATVTRYKLARSKLN